MPTRISHISYKISRYRKKERPTLRFMFVRKYSFTIVCNDMRFCVLNIVAVSIESFRFKDSIEGSRWDLASARLSHSHSLSRFPEFAVYFAATSKGVDYRRYRCELSNGSGTFRPGEIRRIRFRSTTVSSFAIVVNRVIININIQYTGIIRGIKEP